MTHYNIDYTGLKPAEQQAKAIRDIKEWFGSAKKFHSLTAAFKADPTITPRQFEFALSFAGIQGYPVVAWWQHCFPDRPWDENPEIIATKEASPLEEEDLQP